MGWRFRKSVRIAKGVRLNFSKRGVGISIGGKGFRVGVGPKGAYTSTSIPGTGLYSINYLGKRKRSRNEQISTPQTEQQSSYPLELENKTITLGIIIFVASVIFLFVWWPAGLLGIAGLIYWQVQIAKSPDGQARKYYIEGIAALKQDDKPGAIEAFSKVLEAKPNVPSLYPILADLYIEEDNHEKAAVALEKCLEYEPDNNGLKFQYAWTLMCLKRYEQALPLLQALPAEMKQELPVINALAGCFLELKQPELALAVLESGPIRKRNMDEQMKLFRYILGMTYKALGDIKRATNQFNKIYAVDIEYADVKEILEELNSAQSKKS